MQTRIYNGHAPEVEVPLDAPIVLEDGQTVSSVIAVHGEPAEFPDHIAGRLDEQGETWLHPDGESQASKDAQRKAAGKETAAELRARAEEAGITVPGGAKKGEIEALLEQHMQGVSADAQDPSGGAPESNATA